VRTFRERHRSPEEAERIQRRAWQLDGAKYRAESLFADGMSPSAIALQLRVSHHTLLRHLAQPEARWRVGILRRLDMPEPVH
jgi:DNA invertase Pin-like site-specific DNA recombinase